MSIKNLVRSRAYLGPNCWSPSLTETDIDGENTGDSDAVHGRVRRPTMKMPPISLRTVLLTLCCSLQAVAEHMTPSPPPPLLLPSRCVFVAGYGVGDYEYKVQIGNFDGQEACAEAVHAAFPVANGASYRPDVSQRTRCLAELGMVSLGSSAGWCTCLFSNETANHDLPGTPCIHRKPTAGPLVGLYLALVLPVLLAPCLYRGCKWFYRDCRPWLISSPPSPTGHHQADNSSPFVLTMLLQAGFVITVTGMMPLFASKVHSWGPALAPLAFPRLGPHFEPHRFLALLPLGITLMLLSLRPSLANAKYTLVFTGIWMAFAAVMLTIYTEAAISGLTTWEASADDVLDVLRSPEFKLEAAAATLFLVNLSALFPIVYYGSLWRQPTRKLAAWRLTHLWRIWRIAMACVAIWAFVVLIFVAIDPTTPGVGKHGPDGLERIYLWGMLVQGVMFSVLKSPWRIRLQLHAVRTRRQRHASQDTLFEQAANTLAYKISHSAHTVSHFACKISHSAHRISHGIVPSRQEVGLPVWPLVDWPEQPAGLGARLVVQPLGNCPANDSSLQRILRDTDAACMDTVKLGHGGFSVVLRARLDGVQVAVKVARLIGTTDDTLTMAGLRQEVFVMRRDGFHHPHLCSCVVQERGLSRALDPIVPIR